MTQVDELARSLLQALPASASPRLRSELRRFLDDYNEQMKEVRRRLLDVPRENRPYAIALAGKCGELFEGMPMGDDLLQAAEFATEQWNGDARQLGLPTMDSYTPELDEAGMQAIEATGQ